MPQAIRGAVFLLVLAFAALSLPARQAYADELAAGKALFEKVCGACHSLDRPRSKKKTEKQWEATVKRMRKYAGTFTQDEARLIVIYLSANYAEGMP